MNIELLKERTEAVATVRDGIELLKIKKQKFYQQAIAVDNEIKFKQADFSVSQGFDEDDLDPSEDVLKYEDTYLSLNDLQKKKDLIRNRITKIDALIERQKINLVGLQAQERSELDKTLAEVPGEMQLWLALLLNLGEQEKVITYLKQYLKILSDAQVLYTTQTLLMRIMMDTNAIINKHATTALLRESITSSVEATAVEGIRMLAGESKAEKQSDIEVQFKFQDLPDDVQEQLIAQRACLIRLHLYMKLDNVRTENPELYNKLSEYYKFLEKNIKNALLAQRNIAKFSQDIAKIKAELAAREAEMVKYIFRKKFYTKTNAKVAVGAAVSSSVLSWLLGISAPFQTFNAGGIGMGYVLYSKSISESKQQAVAEMAADNELFNNPDIAPIDKALIGELDKKFTAGTAKSLQDIKIAEQTVDGQSLSAMVEISPIIKTHILDRLISWFDVLSLKYKIVTAICILNLIAPALSLISFIPLIGTPLLVTIVCLGVLTPVAYHFGIPLGEVIDSICSFATYVYNSSASYFMNLSGILSELYINIMQPIKTTKKSMSSLAQIRRLNEVFPGLGNKLFDHFEKRNLELQKQINATGIIGTRAINLSIDKLENDLDVIMREISNPEALCKLLERYIQDQYSIEREKFVATVKERSEANSYREGISSYLGFGAKETANEQYNNSAAAKLGFDLSIFKNDAISVDYEVERNGLNCLVELQKILKCMPQHLQEKKQRNRIGLITL